jgi:hypothetical protein
MSDHTHNISLNTILPPAHYHQNNWHPSGFANQPIYYDPNVPPGKMYGMGGAIYANPRDYLQPPTPKEPKMSTIDKIKAERKEKREREELEAKFQEWDTIFASERADVGFFTRDIGDKTYRYAALYADKRWYLTGLESRAFPVEDFIAWLIEKDVLPENFVWLEAVE